LQQKTYFCNVKFGISLFKDNKQFLIMAVKQLRYDILNQLTGDGGTPIDILSQIRKFTDRRYTLQQIKDELLIMYALGIAEVEPCFQATSRGNQLYKKLSSERQTKQQK